MDDEIKINDSVIRLVKGDITDIDVECFVFYAQSNLKLGSGYGTAISVRGGPSIQEELDKLSPIEAGQAVVSEAGNLKASKIIHANGPKFQEENLGEKLKTTVDNCLKLADEKGIKQIAFPAMGTGFYGIPADVCARITIESVTRHLQNGSPVKEVILCMLDNREYSPFKAELAALNQDRS
ncbi:MAG: O-acetyl-ADP-ribose deacetylase [candidate division Zixibacteria bacterium]|nr:O-acetyl-ADP-ribose deacetylase [candidate division Zixibacteria bacterium]